MCWALAEALRSVPSSSDLVPTRPYDVEVVPLLGAVQGEITHDVNYLATHMAERLGARAYQLHAPAFVDTKEHCEHCARWGRSRKSLILPAAPTLPSSVLEPWMPKSRALSSSRPSPPRRYETYRRGLWRCGRYQRLHVYDIEGQPCAHEYADRVVGLTLAELKNIPIGSAWQGQRPKPCPSTARCAAVICMRSSPTRPPHAGSLTF
jgi:hypothetical protein